MLYLKRKNIYKM